MNIHKTVNRKIQYFESVYRFAGNLRINQKIIEKVIKESEENIFLSKIDSGISLISFVKTNLDQLQSITQLIVDMQCLKDSDNDILQSINNIRMIYDQINIIFLAINRKIGDSLLSQIFNLGVYNIISEEDDIETELKKCIMVGKTFKDSVIYKNTSENDERLKKQKSIHMSEKVVVQSQIKKSVNKALIGFSGTMERIGVTHNVIVCANYLKKQGYRIAVIENSTKKSKTFNEIRNLYDIESDSTEIFSFNGLDFYPEFNLDNMSTILTKNYNLVLVDFGLFTEIDLFEFNRCVKQIILCGSKAWEMPKLNDIFDSVNEDVLKNYYYLFNYTDLSFSQEIKDSMEELKDNVFFTDYTPDPLDCFGFDDCKMMFQEYINENVTTEIMPKKTLKEVFGGLINVFPKK